MQLLMKTVYNDFPDIVINIVIIKIIANLKKNKKLRNIRLIP